MVHPASAAIRNASEPTWRLMEKPGLADEFGTLRRAPKTATPSVEWPMAPWFCCGLTARLRSIVKASQRQQRCLSHGCGSVICSVILPRRVCSRRLPAPDLERFINTQHPARVGGWSRRCTELAATGSQRPAGCPWLLISSR